MRKVTLTLAIALLFPGSAVLTADAQTSRGADRIAAGAQNFTLDRTGGLPGMGTLLPSRIYQGLRSVSVLVSAVLAAS
jgi:hypothetical protein